MEEGLSRGMLHWQVRGDIEILAPSYLVVVVSWAAGVQASQEALGLLLDAGRSWHGQQHSSQLLSCHLILLLLSRTDKKHSSVWWTSLISQRTCSSLPSLHCACKLLPSFNTILIASSIYYLTFKEHFTHLHQKSPSEIYGLLPCCFCKRGHSTAQKSQWR